MSEKPARGNRYQRLLEKVFRDGYSAGLVEVPFARADLESAARSLRIGLPKNIGDVIYSVRYRTALPDFILDTQPEGMEWIIEGTGRSSYAFRLVRVNRICPNSNLMAIKIPDATPEIVTTYSLSDEQALLAKVRYNRLVDLFLRLTAYSLQNHLRTTVSGVGQIEIDEIYAGVDRDGRQFIVPVQAKGGADHLSVVQSRQDILCCVDKYPNLICRAVSTQFIEEDLIAMFEMTLSDGEPRLVQERHYRLVSSDLISSSDLDCYRRQVVEE